MSEQYTIITWDPSTSSTSLHQIYTQTVGSIDAYELSPTKFHSLLDPPSAKLIIAIPTSDTPAQTPLILGFALTYLHRSGSAKTPSAQHLKGAIPLLITRPEHRNIGIGTALHQAAIEHLTTSIRESFTLSTPAATKSDIQLGSIFPRIFPGLPNGVEFESAKKWFEGSKRGWVFKDEESIDLFRSVGSVESVRKEVEGLMEKAKMKGIKFGVPKEGDEKDLLEMQERDFGTFTGWPDVFPLLLKSGRSKDIWCAYDAEGKVIGATVAATPGGPVHKMLAWPDTMGTTCAAIACVGVSSTSQGSGAGIALVASALIYLAERGATGCFVDWVSLKGFYQKCGFEKWERGYLEAWKTVEG